MELSGWDAAAVCAKALAYGATLGASGAAFFLVYSGELLQSAAAARVKRLIVGLAGAAIITSGTRILLSSGSMTDSLAGMFDPAAAGMILEAGEGRATGLRIVALLCLLGAVSDRRLRSVAVFGALAASTSFAWVGHAHALPNLTGTLLLSLHLAGAAFWLGALVPLRWAAQDATDGQLAALAARFGKLALYAVFALLAAGGCLLWALIRNAAQFWVSDYGLTMALKLLAVTCLLALAALNKLQLTPRLLAGDPPARMAFQRSVRLEIFAGAVILLITAALTTLTGPPS